MKIAVVTDSSAYLDKQTIEKYGIKVVPIPVIIDGKEYLEDVDITSEQFYDMVRNAKDFPTTSQPPLGKMIELYEQLGDEGYDAVISIHLASTISGFVHNLDNIKQQVTNIKVVPFDSQLTIIMMGMLAVKAAQLTQGKDADLDEVINILEQYRKTMDEVFVVDDLKNLANGGRLSNASAFIGSVLKIKPLLTFDDETHKIVAFDKVRSMKKALKRAESIFEEKTKNIDYPLQVYVIHANAKEQAVAWIEQLKEQFPNIDIKLSYFGPVIGTHLGEGALALAWMEKVTD